MIRLILLLCLFLSLNCLALDVQNYTPRGAHLGYWTMWKPQKLEQGLFGLSGSFNYVKNPLEFGSTKWERSDDIVNRLQSLQFGFFYGLTDKLTLSSSLGGHVLSEYEPVGSSEFEKTISLGDFKLAGIYNLWHGLTLVSEIVVPTGNAEKFIGFTDPTVSLNFVKEWKMSARNWILGNLGYIHRTEERFFNLHVGSAIPFGLGFKRVFSENQLWHWLTEYIGEVPLTGFERDKVNFPIEVLTGLRKQSDLTKNNPWYLDFGGGLGLNNGYGSPDWRVFAGFSTPLGGYKKKVINEVVQTPRESVVLVTPLPISVGQVYFDTNKATLQKRSNPTLNKLTEILNNYPQIRLVSIEGHTDSRGSAVYNKDLSARRAFAVKEFLTRAGISPDRLQSMGFGPDRPIYPNNSAVNRANNRRVEFNIVEATEQLDVNSLKTGAPESSTDVID